MTTHFVRADYERRTPRHYGHRFLSGRAICGVLVHREDEMALHGADPTCPECRQILAEEEAVDVTAIVDEAQGRR